MKIYRCIKEFDELKHLSKQEQDIVLKEYKKGYHFLLFYGKILIIILVVVLSEYLKFLPLGYRIAVYAIAGYWFSVFIDIIELNFISRKVIIDLIHDIHRSQKQ